MWALCLTDNGIKMRPYAPKHPYVNYAGGPTTTTPLLTLLIYSFIVMR